MWERGSRRTTPMLWAEVTCSQNTWEDKKKTLQNGSSDRDFSWTRWLTQKGKNLRFRENLRYTNLRLVTLRDFTCSYMFPSFECCYCTSFMSLTFPSGMEQPIDEVKVAILLKLRFKILKNKPSFSSSESTASWSSRSKPSKYFKLGRSLKTASL